MRRRLALSAALALAVVALAPLAARAAISPPIADCNANGRLTQHYPATVLRTALATMPADIKEYTDCYDVIQRALFADLGKLPGGGSGSSGGSLLPTPVIVVLVVLVAAAAGLGGAALRRRGGGGGDAEPEP